MNQKLTIFRGKRIVRENFFGTSIRIFHEKRETRTNKQHFSGYCCCCCFDLVVCFRLKEALQWNSLRNASSFSSLSSSAEKMIKEVTEKRVLSIEFDENGEKILLLLIDCKA
jgi:hypothetical protein